MDDLLQSEQQAEQVCAAADVADPAEDERFDIRASDGGHTVEEGICRVSLGSDTCHFCRSSQIAITEVGDNHSGEANTSRSREEVADDLRQGGNGPWVEGI